MGLDLLEIWSPGNFARDKKFGPAVTWCIHKSENFAENRDFEMKIDHPIPVRKVDQVLISKKKIDHSVGAVEYTVCFSVEG